jgi:hypothetical protein
MLKVTDKWKGWAIITILLWPDMICFPIIEIFHRTNQTYFNFSLNSAVLKLGAPRVFLRVAIQIDQASNPSFVLFLNVLKI